MKKKIIVGVTGGFATGKSTVLALYKKFGADVIDSDVIVHDILENDTGAKKKIFCAFGDVADEKFGINRKKLGAIVFSDKKMRLKLERIIHPIVKKVIDQKIKQSKSELIAVDVPLLFESRMKSFFDYVVTVYCCEKFQIERAMKRDSIGCEDALKRIKAQLPLSYKVKHSDFVVDTNGTRKNIEKQVWNIIDKINK